MNVVIVGNSAAGLEAVRSFRKYDKKSPITLISKEGRRAYSRVLLPYVLRGRLPYESVNTADDSFYTDYGVRCLEDEVLALDPSTQEVKLKSGTTLSFDKILIATGSHARKPPVEGLDLPGVNNMWTRGDIQHLLPFFEKTRQRVVVVGSGFVSLQGAWAACYRGHKVTVLEIADRVMPTVLSADASGVIRRKMEEKGVAVHTGAHLLHVNREEDGALSLNVRDMPPLLADCIIVGAGVSANIAFLKDTGVEHDRAIPVDAYMRTNCENVYAAGDVAAGPSVFGQAHVVHALWPTAVEMGAIAGANMAGKSIAYSGSLNMNVTQMFDVTVASMGIFDPAMVDEHDTFPVDENEQYLSVSHKGGLICGACLVGRTESVKLLGKLRPLIRARRRVNCPPDKLESYLDIVTMKIHL